MRDVYESEREWEREKERIIEGDVIAFLSADPNSHLRPCLDPIYYPGGGAEITHKISIFTPKIGRF